MIEEKKTEDQGQQVIEAEVVDKQLVRQDGPALPARVEQKLDVAAVVEQVKAVQELMGQLMEEDLHYGKIPGSGKKAKSTLLKPGAELLCVLFRLSPELKITRTDLGAGHREYEVVTTLRQNTTGRVFGQGVGSCTTQEKKYAWRKTELSCPECGYAPVRKSKHAEEWYCWKSKGGCGTTWPLDAHAITEQAQESKPNPDLADTYNTILKMAKKRSLVDAVLTCTSASFLFTQDVEDVGKEGKGYDAAEGGGGDGDPGPGGKDAKPAAEKKPPPKKASPKKDEKKPPKSRTLTTEEVERAVALFEPFGVDLERLEKKLGKPCDNWNLDDAQKLKGLHDALGEEGLAAEDLFR